MMTELKSAVVLITGSTGGFGRELSRQLIAKGSRLILTDLSQEQLDGQVHELRPSLQQGAGEILAVIAADLSTPAGSEALYTATQQLAVPVDVLINNAGLALLGNMVDLPQPDWEKLMQVNLLTPMRLSSLFAAAMLSRGGGHIVSISSLAGWIAIPGLATYAASKYGLRGFSAALRYEVAPYNIQVTTVYPFFSRTPILESPRFGGFAEDNTSVPPALTTDPAKIMARTIRAIEHNQAEVFPDPFAWGCHLLQRYLPVVPTWISRRRGMRR
jgi:short-subunit dehydrogenase